MALAYDRLERLIDSGLRRPCTVQERIRQLKRKASQVDHETLPRLEQIFFSLADRTRIEILRLIADDELCACELMAVLNLTQPTTSHHLGILEKAGLITSRRQGRWVFYRLANRKVANLLVNASGLAKRG
jgi:ArsR family transcriptional regulator